MYYLNNRKLKKIVILLILNIAFIEIYKLYHQQSEPVNNKNQLNKLLTKLISGENKFKKASFLFNTILFESIYKLKKANKQISENIIKNSDEINTFFEIEEGQLLFNQEFIDYLTDYSKSQNIQLKEELNFEKVNFFIYSIKKIFNKKSSCIFFFINKIIVYVNKNESII